MIVGADITKRTSVGGANQQVPGAVARFVFALSGTALMASSIGLWVVPTAASVPEVTLMKLGISVLMLMGGLFCFVSMRGHQP